MSGEMNTYTAELDRSVTMSTDLAPASVQGVVEKKSAVDREVRVILPSPYEGSSPRGVR
jgi:hypothetical protein